SSRRRHTRSDRDWSSDVCSSDLIREAILIEVRDGDPGGRRPGLQQRGWSRRKAGVPIVEKNADRVIGLIHHGKVRLCVAIQIARSEERRVGKECRCRWWRAKCNE